MPCWRRDFLLPPAAVSVCAALPNRGCVPMAKARASIGGRLWQRPTRAPCTSCGVTCVGTSLSSHIYSQRLRALALSWRDTCALQKLWRDNRGCSLVLPVAVPEAPSTSPGEEGAVFTLLVSTGTVLSRSAEDTSGNRKNAVAVRRHMRMVPLHLCQSHCRGCRGCHCLPSN